MPAKIRLQRKGKKGQPFYHIVIADGRAPREGRFIERIGTYNPLARPAEIEINFDKAIGWLQNGAQPTDTVKAILSYKGVLIKKHLLEGVKKGAFDEAEATKRFEEWMKQNDAKVESKKSGLEKSRDDEVVKKLTAEKKVNEARAAKLSKKQADLAAKAEAADKAEAVAEEKAPAAEVIEAPVAPEAPIASEASIATEAPEAPAADKATEAAAEEKPQ